MKREEELLTLQGRPADGQCPPGRPWPHPPRVLQGHREQLSDKARGWPSYAHTALHTSPAAFGREQPVPLPATADIQHPTHAPTPTHTHTHTLSLSLSLSLNAKAHKTSRLLRIPKTATTTLSPNSDAHISTSSSSHEKRQLRTQRLHLLLTAAPELQYV